VYAGALLEVRDLRTHFFVTEGVVPAVDGVDFSMNAGETLGIVGESGCGKTVTALSLMRLVQSPPGRYVSGRVLFGGTDLLRIPESEMRDVRGKSISMVFQDPMTSFNPVYTIGRQIAEAIRAHEAVPLPEALSRAERLLALVGMPDPGRCVNEYPHQMSGGMRQRAMIAMALAGNPKVLIADEPTTALDVTIQAQILELLKRIKQEMGMSIILISHDLGVIAEMADRVVVMYAGKVAEEAPVATLFADPWHPYTRGLMSCIPRIDLVRDRLPAIEGTVPSPIDFPPGCRFKPRCGQAEDICRTCEPPMINMGGHRVACHVAERALPGGDVR
jgi:oligopeptide/dipeptide ABC transporter ATP-binding protein